MARDMTSHTHDLFRIVWNMVTIKLTAYKPATTPAKASDGLYR